MFSIVGQGMYLTKVIGLSNKCAAVQRLKSTLFPRFYLRSCSDADKLCEFGHILAASFYQALSLYMLCEDNLVHPAQPFSKSEYLYKPTGLSNEVGYWTFAPAT